MRHYEVTFIIDPVLSDDEIKQTAKTYKNLIKEAGAKIVHEEDMGLRELAYEIKKRKSGRYIHVEYSIESGAFIDSLELAFRRDERVIRFLTVKLDKFAIQYNIDKRAGKFNKKKKSDELAAEEASKAMKAGEA